MTTPLNMTPKQVKRLRKNLGAPDAHREEFTMSELMMEYVRRVEKAKGGRLVGRDEVGEVTPEARDYAKNIRKWMAKRPAAQSPQEKAK
jgi:hypothetical protein